MGYTHYRYTNRGHFGPRKKSRRDGLMYVESEEFDKKRQEFQIAAYKILKEADVMGIKTGNGRGENRPVINATLVNFTGSKMQPAGRRTRQPNPMVDTDGPTQLDTLLSGIFSNTTVIKGGSESGIQRPDHSLNLDPLNTKGKATGTRFAGAQVSAPSINNPNNKPYVDGSYESVTIATSAEYKEGQTEDQLNSRPEKDRREFGCCKTNYYPYDIAVTAVLIAAYSIFGYKAFRVSSDGDKKDWIAGHLLCKKATGIDDNFYLRGEETEWLYSETKKIFGEDIHLEEHDSPSIFPAQHTVLDSHYGQFIVRDTNEVDNKRKSIRYIFTPSHDQYIQH